MLAVKSVQVVKTVKRSNSRGHRQFTSIFLFLFFFSIFLYPPTGFGCCDFPKRIPFSWFTNLVPSNMVVTFFQYGHCPWSSSNWNSPKHVFRDLNTQKEKSRNKNNNAMKIEREERTIAFDAPIWGPFLSLVTFLRGGRFLAAMTSFPWSSVIGGLFAVEDDRNRRLRVDVAGITLQKRR